MLIGLGDITDRDKAKVAFQKHLTYTMRPHVIIPTEWDLPDNHFLRTLVQGVNTYRDMLFREGKPTKFEPRHVFTLTTRKICGVRSEKHHRGKMLAWRIQGTLADVFAPVLGRILDDDEKGLCKLFLPVHDCVFVAIKQDSKYSPKRIMDEEAKKAGLPLRTETRYHDPIGA